MSVAATRAVIVLALIALLEICCRTGLISSFELPAPSTIAVDLVEILWSGRFNGAIVATLSNVAIAFAMAMIFGILCGWALHQMPTVRRIVDPVFAAYYAIPLFAFYPLFIMMFGLNAIPQIVVGFLMAVVTVIANALTGLDRVPSQFIKTARIARMSRLNTMWRIVLPSAMPHLFAGAKLAIAYAFVGVVGSEFIMASTGLGYEISNAYTLFSNRVMYPLIAFVMIVAGILNLAMHWWEGALNRRYGI